MKTNEEIKASGVYDIKLIAPGMFAGFMKLPECKRSTVVWGRNENGMEHVSVAPLNRFHTPNWSEMCLVKDTFFYAEEECYEIHPKHSQYVNKVDNCLHIWRPKNGMTIDALANVNMGTKTNNPLSIEDLREMDREPVWIVEFPEWGHWELSEDAEDYFADRDPAYYGLQSKWPAGPFGLHPLGWLAFRSKTEDVT